MSKQDNKKLESLADRLVDLMSKIYNARKLLNELENEASKLLRKLLNRDDNQR